MASVSVCVRSPILVSPWFRAKQFDAKCVALPRRPTSVSIIFKSFRTKTNKDRRLRLKASLNSKEPEGADVSGMASSETRQDDGGLATELSKAVRKTAVTFAPGASKKQRNPAVPGSTLYKVFEIQAYIGLGLGALLSYNLLFPSSEPDIWRLMGMWSVWMFTIPSLRARDCPEKEKEALNYLFLLVPLINITLPLVWKSFAAVYTADVTVFLSMYAWKMEWLSGVAKSEDV